MLYTKYQCSSPCGLRQEDFYMIDGPPGQDSFDPRGII